jgi:Zn-dependent M16 (insulinase) family peptidase
LAETNSLVYFAAPSLTTTKSFTTPPPDLTVQKVRKFHEKFYRPENVCVVVAGNVPEENLIDGFEKVDKNLFEQNPFRKRPAALPDMSTFGENRSIDLLIPETSDDCGGIVCVGFRGPSAKTHPEIVLASVVLMEYLVSTSQNVSFFASDPTDK